MSIIHGTIVNIHNHTSSNHSVIEVNGLTILVENPVNYKIGDALYIATKRTVLKPIVANHFKDLLDREKIVKDEIVDGVENEGVDITSIINLPNIVSEIEKYENNLDKALTFGEIPLEPRVKIDSDTRMTKCSIVEKPLVVGNRTFDVMTQSNENLDRNFLTGAFVAVSEKIDGSQMSIHVIGGKIQVKTKRNKEEGLQVYTLDELEVADYSNLNTYYSAIRNSNILPSIREYIKNNPNHKSFILTGECYPWDNTKIFHYGLTPDTPNLKLFGFSYNDGEYHYMDITRIPNEFKEQTLPFFITTFTSLDDFKVYANAPESISGNQLHNREGVVITNILRYDHENNYPRSIKVLASTYNKKSNKKPKSVNNEIV